MLFLSDVCEAQFARKKPEKEEKSTLREKIIGRTNAGKAFRVGVLASALGLGGLALKNKDKLGALKNPKEYYTRNVNDLPKTVKTTMTHSKVKNVGDHVYISDKGAVKVVTDPQQAKTRKPGTFLDDQWQKDTNIYDSTVRETYSKDKEKGFLGTDRKLKWGKIGKTVAIGGGALALPTGLAYLAGSKKDKEDIERRLNSVSKSASKGLESTRRLINTLHRVSR